MFQTILLVASLAAPPRAPTIAPPQAPPVKANDYETFKAAMNASPAGTVVRGYLTIGPVDLHTGSGNHCRVDSGAFGKEWPDGVYECFGGAKMRPLQVPQAMATPGPILNAVSNVVKYCTKNGCYYVTQP